MRITHIRPMREKMLDYTTRQLVAFALAAGLLATGSLAGPTGADGSTGDIAGSARVVDGDTIQVGETRIRLEGIDAPEAGQTCGRRLVGWWACGTEATAALGNLIEGKAVRCVQRGLDKYRRVLATCFLGTDDVNAWMVRQGLAWAFVRYSSVYVREEAEARGARRGIWQGEATPAWEHRAQRWVGVEQQAPEGCAIKGNVTAHGKIYHMPWSPWYGRIKMDPDKGKRWFCTEAEAVAAGWRPVNVH
jgi:endonuclease YncB( thermonuclease family)